MHSANASIAPSRSRLVWCSPDLRSELLSAPKVCTVETPKSRAPISGPNFINQSATSGYEREKGRRNLFQQFRWNCCSHGMHGALKTQIVWRKAVPGRGEYGATFPAPASGLGAIGTKSTINQFEKLGRQGGAIGAEQRELGAPASNSQLGTSTDVNGFSSISVVQIKIRHCRQLESRLAALPFVLLFCANCCHSRRRRCRRRCCLSVAPSPSGLLLN